MDNAAVKPIPVRKQKSRTRKAVEGTGAALALLAALEVALQFLAEGTPDPTLRLVAGALAVGIGAFLARR